jgi:hypothetical protein
MVTLLPGYGFDSDGMVTFVSPDHDEMAKQRGFQKTKPAKSEAQEATPGAAQATS